MKVTMKWVCISLVNPTAQCMGHKSRKQAWASKPCATKFGNVTRMILKEAK